VPFYVEHYSQNPPFRNSIICNERLDGLLNSCFMARMNFLTALGTLILKIPLGILKNVAFYEGLLPVFRTQDQDLDYMSLSRAPKFAPTMYG
jgi:hypothetical protein